MQGVGQEAPQIQVMSLISSFFICGILFRRECLGPQKAPLSELLRMFLLWKEGMSPLPKINNNLINNNNNNRVFKNYYFNRHQPLIIPHSQGLLKSGSSCSTSWIVFKGLTGWSALLVQFFSTPAMLMETWNFITSRHQEGLYSLYIEVYCSNYGKMLIFMMWIISMQWAYIPISFQNTFFQ